jgi:hypothetical protein
VIVERSHGDPFAAAFREGLRRVAASRREHTRRSRRSGFVRRKPLRTQIDNTRARLTAIDSGIRDLDRRGGDLRQQHGVMQAKIDGVVGRMIDAYNWIW